MKLLFERLLRTEKNCKLTTSPMMLLLLRFDWLLSRDEAEEEMRPQCVMVSPIQAWGYHVQVDTAEQKDERKDVLSNWSISLPW